MPITSNGDVALHHESFGDASNPTLLLVNGLGSQCINFKEAFCERLAARGFHVVRFDNRDVGLSSHLPDGPEYTLDDMADDAFAVLDAVGASRAHVAGWSMGGMIVQTMAIRRPERLLSVTSVMSTPGGGPVSTDDEVLAQFNAPPATDRAGAVERHLAGLKIWGTPAAWDVERITADAEAAFDRCFDPKGVLRQMQAIGRSGSRVEALGGVTVPFLVIHGDRDRLVDPDGGRRTAAAVPGARFELVEGMGHDYPPLVWDTMIDLVAGHAAGASA
ncbi:MAG TPA: alpha/beta hydrolase [Acidimicrobiales bacterium]|nr:alpha/beta hydrolase [Acidimicrobiales bacterium]